MFFPKKANCGNERKSNGIIFSIKVALFIFLIIMLLLPGIIYSQDKNKNVLKKSVVVGEQFSIVLENNKDGGKWTLTVYDPEYLEIIEDRKSNPLKTTVIFYPVETGTAEVRFNYILNKTREKEIKYLLNITEKPEEKIEDTAADNDWQNTSQNTTYSNFEGTSDTDYWTDTGEEDTEHSITLVEELISRGMYKEALSTLDKVKRDFPAGALPLELAKLEGKALLNLPTPDYEEAIKRMKTYLDSALSADIYVKEIAEVHLRIGEIYFISKNYNKAEYTYIEVISFYSDQPDILTKAYVGLADVYLLTDKTTKAIEELERALDTEIEESVLEEVLIRLARIYFNKEKFKDYDLSYRYYNMLRLLFPFGKYRDEAVERSEYIEKNFINYGG